MKSGCEQQLRLTPEYAGAPCRLIVHFIDWNDSQTSPHIRISFSQSLPATGRLVRRTTHHISWDCIAGRGQLTSYSGGHSRGHSRFR